MNKAEGSLNVRMAECGSGTERKAVDYLKKRTPARAAVMIAAVWLMSALVCIPPLLGWRVTRPPERFPQCKVSFVTNATRSVSARCRIVS
ncbi:unnamed protein product [Plutella xylostella]|uniref:(diamondback moth) hypothetical protein n=1 Tax=Plutella xylostella TaxID=51655 RepID=A0A8S4ERG7_PLUXY|nr:unnamed protein product [Plutella xylostella]